MNAHEHIGELAELYALGALNDVERAGVDRHVRSCAECAARVGDAERLVADTIAEREPPAQLDRRVRATLAPRRAPALMWAAFAAAIAAAFVIGLFVQRPQPFEADRDRALVAMVGSHFLHAQFTLLATDAPQAKVIYGRGKPWRFFIAQTTRAYVVRTQSGVVLGAMHVSGDAAELFVANTTARTFELFDGSRPVAKVTLPLSPARP